MPTSNWHSLLQNMQNKQKEVKSKVTITYRKRLRQILKSRLNAKHKITAINTYAMPVTTYTAGITDWNKKEMQDLDRLTRKTMNMYGRLHPRAETHTFTLAEKVAEVHEKSQQQSESNVQDYGNTSSKQRKIIL